MKTVGLLGTVSVTLPALNGDADGKGEAARDAVFAKVVEMVSAESASFEPCIAAVAASIEKQAGKLLNPMGWRIVNSDSSREDMAYRMIDTAMSSVRR